MNFKSSHSMNSLNTLSLEAPEEEDHLHPQAVVRSVREVLGMLSDDLNGAVANVCINIQTTLSIILFINNGLKSDKDKVLLSIGILSICFSYLCAFLMSQGKPFFQGISLIQALVVQNQIQEFGRQSLFLTCMVTGLLIILLTCSRVYRLFTYLPTFMVVAIQTAIGRLV